MWEWAAVLFYGVHDLPKGQKKWFYYLFIPIFWFLKVFALNAVIPHYFACYYDLSECTKNGRQWRLGQREEPRFGGSCVRWGRQENCLSSNARLGFSLALGYKKRKPDCGREGSLQSSCLVWHQPLLTHNNSICPQDALCAWSVPFAHCTSAKDGSVPWDQHLHAHTDMDYEIHKFKTASLDLQARVVVIW